MAVAFQPLHRRLRRLSELVVHGEPSAAPAVAVRTLGGFRVLRGGEALPASAWQSRKARTLLKILVARRGRPVPREALMELLWPGEDPAKLSNRLSVALSSVRSVLGPRCWCRPSREPWRSTWRSSTSTSSTSWPRSRRGDMARAVGRYRGDFLEEDLYEDWAADLREEAGAAYTAALRALARAAPNADEAVRAHLRILERDRWDAEAHLALVRVLEASGRHGEATRRYRAYEAAMAEIGVRPEPL